MVFLPDSFLPSFIANDYLQASANEQWVCPDIIDFPLLATFANQDNTLAPSQFISTTAKSSHPESTLVRLLHRLQNPSPRIIPRWAKIVAASIELMADNLYKPPPPQTSHDQDATIHGVHVLQYLEKLKSSTSPFDTQDACLEDTGTEVVQRSHSVDVLHEFRNMIIDVFMGDIIFQTHSLSSPPLSSSQKNKKFRTTRASAKAANRNSQVTATNKPPAELAQLKEESTKQLHTIQGRHNFQPLICFVLAGVRGLFISSMEYRLASVSESMSFLEAMSIITQHSKTPRKPDEPIWKNLSAYLVELFRPSFQSPHQIVPLAQPPSVIKLAEAITMDFLNHWNDKQPSSPFLIPHSTCPVTDS